jgi:hypothetical protein
VLARDFGVNRALIRSFRQDERRTFTRGTDYDTVGRNVQWTKAGALRLCNALGVIPSRDLLDGAPMSHTVNGKEALRDTAAVVRWRIPNPHLLLCKRNTGGEEVWVSVPSNLNFRERMTVKIFLDVNGWRLDGRCPRFPGRW